MDSNEFTLLKLKTVLPLIMENRGDKVVYVSFEDKVPFSDAVGLLSAISKDYPPAHVALLTDRLVNEHAHAMAGGLCGLEWPKGEIPESELERFH